MKTWIAFFLVLVQTLASKQIDVEQRFASEVLNVTFQCTVESYNVSAKSINDALIELRSIALDGFTEVLGSESSSAQLLDFTSTRSGNCTSLVSTGRCALVDITITWSADSEDEDLIRSATLSKTNQYIEQFNHENDNVVVITYLGPTIVSSNIVIRLENVNRVMDDDEVDVFQATLMQVLNPLDGGVTLTSVKVFLQQMKSKGQRRLFETSTNDVHVRVDGQCKGCNSGEFGMLVNDAVDSSSSEVEEELKNNDDGAYFDNVSVSSVDDEASSSSGTVNAVSSVTKASSTSAGVPYFVLYAVAGGVAVVLAGAFLVVHRNRRAKLHQAAKLQIEHSPSAVSRNSIQRSPSMHSLRRSPSMHSIRRSPSMHSVRRELDDPYPPARRSSRREYYEDPPERRVRSMSPPNRAHLQLTLG